MDMIEWLMSKVQFILNKLTLRVQNVVIISFPKSGRTWLRIMLDDLNVPALFYHGTSKFDKMRTPDTVYQSIPKMFGKSVIFITRDPRDTVVSNYFYTKDRKKLHNMSLSEFLRNDKTGIEKIITFNLYLFEHQDKFKKFKHLRYEDLHRNTVDNIRQCLGFMNILFINNHRISTVVQNREFKSMQKDEQEGILHQKYGHMFAEGGIQNSNEGKLRSGKYGDYLNNMAEDDLEFCRSIFKKYNYPVSLLCDDCLN